MADPEGAEPGTDPLPSRRHRRRVRAHRRRRRVIAIGCAVVAVCAGIAIATDTLRFGSSRPTLARAVDEPVVNTGAAPGPTTTSQRRLPCRSGLTADKPLRLWVGGDSLAGSLGPALGTIAGRTGVVQPYFHSRVSSGLSNPGFVDWPALATREMNGFTPDIVVFIISTNDYSVPMNTRVDPASGEPAWRATYAKQVDDLLAIFEQQGRIVVWLGAPVLADRTQNDGVTQLNAVERDVVARHAARSEYFDTYGLTADADGKYRATATGDDGKPVVIRAGDGVHFTPDGGDFLARAVFALLDRQCAISAQAVPGAARVTIETPGSTQIAPRSGGSGGGSIATTPPATNTTGGAPTTAAVATTAPAAAAPTTTSPPSTTVPPTTTSPSPTSTPRPP